MGRTNISEDWTAFGRKQILSVGKKRQRLHDADEDSADGNASSSDEEEGRTSAVRERRTKKPPAIVTKSKPANDTQSSDRRGLAAETPNPEKKKKKKGKKERARELAIQAESKSGEEETGLQRKVEGDNTEEDGVAGRNKRKRKKTRSRQKNIRKDNRSIEDRPTHLVRGSADYAGRPLTFETKKKLGIARTDQQQTAKAFGGNWAEEKVETSVVDKSTRDRRQSGAKDENEALTMIGDCVVSEAPIENKANKPKTKRKRKFKNV
mmetsp:Transcript_1239/g.2839  ORF Transcript_1239/g.2839 Transcript_1239/m.2839 type:complete len:265 (+) Transcript_1239:110-904(+)